MPGRSSTLLLSVTRTLLRQIAQLICLSMGRQSGYVYSTLFYLSTEHPFMQMSNDLLNLASYLVNSLLHLLKSRNIPVKLVSLPSHLHTFHRSPIIPVLTNHP